MKKLSLAVLTLTAAGFSVLPVNAIETQVNQTSQQADASQQIKEATTTAGCYYIPGYGWRCN